MRGVYGKKDIAHPVQIAAGHFHRLDGIGEGRRIGIGRDFVHFGQRPLDAFAQGGQVMLVLDQIEWWHAKRRIPVREQGVPRRVSFVGGHFAAGFCGCGAGFLSGLLTACEYQAGGQHESHKTCH